MKFNLSALIKAQATANPVASLELLTDNGSVHTAVMAENKEGTSKRFAFFSCQTEPTKVRFNGKGEVFPAGTDTTVVLSWGRTASEAENKVRNGQIEHNIGTIETTDGFIVTVYSEQAAEQEEVTMKALGRIYEGI